MIKRIINKVLRNLFDSRGAVIGPRMKSGVDIKEVRLSKGFKLKIYKPTANKSGKALPVFIYYHGGGWTIGSLKAYGPMLKYLCYHTGFIVVGVEYRKAPEHKFPQAAYDALEGYNWVINNIEAIGGDISKIMIGGDSAGGNLTCVVLNYLQDKKQPLPIKQVLIYPVLDASEEGIKRARESKRWWVGKLGSKILDYQLSLYTNTPEDLKSPLMCPNISDLDLSNTETLIITAEFDPLFIGAGDYIKALQKNSYSVIHKHYAKTFHGFINFAGVSPKGLSALREIVKFLLE
ncbi:alpha/beta hydrolase [endosymbiont of Acanthamoeba sp. UWC8]|uniref:alpha/beta hydrolase n=1 Tax=endosymbiont of Acanthamoeba sp. UWC8 TaxID=86106 RepID=UPI0004D0F04C|nr:alpha/beta hydrolase [endosymbiont of Acanthamoeba sp. UWC8]AIF80629.1 alpha/beta hydrolase [endosymbiont of Acanthamoeba sp. UWC8]